MSCAAGRSPLCQTPMCCRAPATHPSAWPAMACTGELSDAALTCSIQEGTFLCIFGRSTAILTHSMPGPGASAGFTLPAPTFRCQKLPQSVQRSNRSLFNVCVGAANVAACHRSEYKASCSSAWPKEGFLVRGSQTHHVMACAGRVACSWRAPPPSCATARLAPAVSWKTAHWCGLACPNCS